MSWLKLSLPAAADEHEALEAAFEALGAAALTLVPLDDAVPWEPAPGQTPVAPANRLEALFDLDGSLAGLSAALHEALPARALDQLAIEFLGDEDWQARALAEAVRAHFGERLWLL
ncbi:MAG: 50S ribosomal protein L11 methyltransferase, partial [Pseudomonadota bacterium]